jgi:trehalose synthase-fused probable maltokinase
MTTGQAQQTANHTGSADHWPLAVAAIAEAALPEFLLRQRWYPAKDAGLPEVKLAVLEPFADAESPSAIALWEVTPPGQETLCVFVPLTLTASGARCLDRIASMPGEGGTAALAIVDAITVDSFVRAWVATIRGSSGRRLRPGHTAYLADTGLADTGWSIRRGKVEQSNTSMRVGEQAILKFIRTVEAGIHPEVEVGRFFAEHKDFAATARLLGWVELAGESIETTTLSILQAYAPNRGDGWRWVVERLGEGMQGRAKPLDETIVWLRRLGTRMAEMHKAFAVPSDDPSFAPEPVTKEDVQGWAADARTRAWRALDALMARREQLAPTAKDIADRLTARRDRLVSEMDRLTPRPGSFSKTRHHGDFHLGQVLVTGDDAVIIDFEGEPMRPLAERRAKHAPLRDVAGLLRSLSYAAATAARDLPKDAIARRAELSAWEGRASEAFCDAYLAAMKGVASLPSGASESQRMVRFFKLEKAFYEIAYELANRPDWVEVPMRGVLEMIGEDSKS